MKIYLEVLLLIIIAPKMWNLLVGQEHMLKQRLSLALRTDS